MTAARTIHKWQEMSMRAIMAHELFVICHSEIRIGIKDKHLRTYRTIQHFCNVQVCDK